MFCVVGWFVENFGYLNDTTKERANLGQLFRVGVALPNSKGVALGILAHSEVTHLWYRCFRLANLAAELLDVFGEVTNRIYADVVDHWLLCLFASLDATVGPVLATGSIDVPILLRSREALDFPAKQVAIEFFGALRVIGRYSKPDDAVSLFFL